MTQFILIFVDGKNLNINLSLRQEGNNGHIQEWWDVDQTELGKIPERSGEKKNDTGLELYVFSDQVSPPSLGFLAGYG